MSDIADRLRTIADVVEATDDNGLPTFDGYRMCEEEETTVPGLNVYIDGDGDVWLQAGDSYPAYCIGGSTHSVMGHLGCSGL